MVVVVFTPTGVLVVVFTPTGVLVVVFVAMVVLVAASAAVLVLVLRHRYASSPTSSAACSRPMPMSSPTWSSESE